MEWRRSRYNRPWKLIVDFSSRNLGVLFQQRVGLSNDTVVGSILRYPTSSALASCWVRDIIVASKEHTDQSAPNCMVNVSTPIANDSLIVKRDWQRQIETFFSLHTVLFIPRPHKRFLVVFDFTAEVSFFNVVLVLMYTLPCPSAPMCIYSSTRHQV